MYIINCKQLFLQFLENFAQFLTKSQIKACFKIRDPVFAQFLSGILDKTHSGLKIRDFRIIIFDILLGEAIAGQLMFIIDQWIFEGPITTPSERPTKKVKVCVSGQNEYSVIARSGVEVLSGL